MGFGLSSPIPKNANACTGDPGLANSRATQAFTAEALGIEPNQVLVMSTGVIGVQLPMDKLEAGVVTAVPNLSRSAESGLEAAKAIMTTDTVPKHFAISVALSGGTVTIGRDGERFGDDPSQYGDDVVGGDDGCAGGS